MKKHPNKTETVWGLFENTVKMIQEKHKIIMIFFSFLMPSGSLLVLTFDLVYKKKKKKKFPKWNIVVC